MPIFIALAYICCAEDLRRYMQMCIPLACNKYIVYAYIHFMGKLPVCDQDASLDALVPRCSRGVQ